MYDTNNIFAKILRKEIKCSKIFEDDKVLFFNDAYPQAKIHILGIPKIEVINFSDFIIKADDKMINHFFFKVYEITNSFGIDKSGYRIVANSGKDANQEVPHFHVHILGGESLKEIK